MGRQRFQTSWSIWRLFLPLAWHLQIGSMMQSKHGLQLFNNVFVCFIKKGKLRFFRVNNHLVMRGIQKSRTFLSRCLQPWCKIRWASLNWTLRRSPRWTKRLLEKIRFLEWCSLGESKMASIGVWPCLAGAQSLSWQSMRGCAGIISPLPVWSNFLENWN